MTYGVKLDEARVRLLDLIEAAISPSLTHGYQTETDSAIGVI